MKNLFFVLFVFVASTFYAQQKDKGYSPLVVLELFTSQGCSSCPPADKLLEEVKTMHKGQVIALSYHVDYWNYIGWKDPFSKASFSNKQREYGSKFSSSSIYTPQVVVNGKEHFVGSNKSTMQNKIEVYSKSLPKNTVAISNLKKEKNRIHFNYEITGDITKKNMKIALAIKERITSVKRGENRNRTLKNTNIVVEEIYLNLDNLKGKAEIVVPDIVIKSDELSIVALVQSDNLDISGGTQISL